MTSETPVGPRHGPEFRIFKVEPKQPQDFEVGGDTGVGVQGKDGVGHGRIGRRVVRLERSNSFKV